MKRAMTGRGRGVLAAGMLLAALGLAGCESAEEQEIRALIEEVEALYEEALRVIESRSEAQIAAVRERGWGSVEETRERWEQRAQSARDAHERTQRWMREALDEGNVRQAERLAENWRMRQARIDAHSRLPTVPRREGPPPSAQELLEMLGSGGTGPEAGR